jgi:lipopolysaccharide export system permease protein
MRVVTRYIVREIGSHAVAGFLVVVGIFVMTRLSSLLSDAAVGSLPAAVVAKLLGLRTLMALPSLLPAVVYIGVLLGISRLSRDDELTALEACGVSPLRIDLAVLVFAAGAAAAVAVLSFSGRPWAATRFNQVRERAIAQAGLENVTPGFFVATDSEPGSHEVLFAESRSRSDPRYLENVFVQRRTDADLLIFWAQRAIEQRDPAAGVRYLTLLDGTQYDLRSNGEPRAITRFHTFTLRLPLPELEPDLSDEKTDSVWTLLDSDDLRARAELQWRGAMPVSTMLLALLAVPLARGDLRRGRSVRILVALLLYLAYRTVLGTARQWVADGVLPALPGLWLVHAACLLTALALHWRPGLTARWVTVRRPSERAADSALP